MRIQGMPAQQSRGAHLCRMWHISFTLAVKSTPWHAEPTKLVKGPWRVVIIQRGNVVVTDTVFSAG